MEFKAEADVLSQLIHPNVILFLGFHTGVNDEKFLVFEYMTGGNLLDLLKKEGYNLDITDFFQMAVGAVNGMHYLETKKFLHRDLAARNLLVQRLYNSWNVKVSDFGLSRSSQDGIYVLSEKSALPARWTAPEVFQNRTFSVKSDIWSMGVVLWEIFTKGDNPYPTLLNTEVIDGVIKGERLTRPNSCPDEVWRIMNNCWNEDPSKRPSFLEIADQLTEVMTKIDDTDSSFEEDPKDNSYNTPRFKDNCVYVPTDNYY